MYGSLVAERGAVDHGVHERTRRRHKWKLARTCTIELEITHDSMHVVFVENVRATASHVPSNNMCSWAPYTYYHLTTMTVAANTVNQL